MAASLICVGLIAARSWYSHTYHYWFLLWNLVLAWVPFVFAAIAYRLASARRAVLYVLIFAAAVVWLAFFPNAPYILTDFLHLGSMGDIVPGWYDVLMLYWFAWTGLILGIVSLYLMQEIVAHGLGMTAGWVFVVVAAGLGSFGIYLGRFLRWNSWDIVRRPGPLADELLGRVTDPASQPRLLGFTLLFALLFLFIYVAVYIFAKLTKPPGGASAPDGRPARRAAPRRGACRPPPRCVHSGHDPRQHPSTHRDAQGARRRRQAHRLRGRLQDRSRPRRPARGRRAHLQRAGHQGDAVPARLLLSDRR